VQALEFGLGDIRRHHRDAPPGALHLDQGIELALVIHAVHARGDQHGARDPERGEQLPVLREGDVRRREQPFGGKRIPRDRTEDVRVTVDGAGRRGQSGLAGLGVGTIADRDAIGIEGGIAHACSRRRRGYSESA